MNLTTEGVSVETEVVPPDERVMDVDVYQAWTIQTAIYRGAGKGARQELEYLTIGLCSEAGEIAGIVKKIARDTTIDVDWPLYIESDENDAPALCAKCKNKLAHEISDVLYYLARLGTVVGLDMSEIAYLSHTKLADRMNRDVIKGSGDER